MAVSNIKDGRYVCQYLDYNPLDGTFLWKERPLEMFKTIEDQRSWNTQHAGKHAGTFNQGYIQINILGDVVLAHRLAWLVYYGAWPSMTIDHINGIRHDNRIENLRCVTISEQRKNSSRAAKNSTGVMGVRWTRNAYQVEIGVDGKNIYLGRFKSLAQAAAARKAAEVKYGFHANHGRG